MAASRWKRISFIPQYMSSQPNLIKHISAVIELYRDNVKFCTDVTPAPFSMDQTTTT